MTAERSRYTPGPWRWENGIYLVPANPDPQHYAVHTITGPHGGCGFLASGVQDTARELEADRALIEAAPQLVEALRALRNAASVALANSLVLAQADAALAKVLGPGS